MPLRYAIDENHAYLGQLKSTLLRWFAAMKTHEEISFTLHVEGASPMHPLGNKIAENPRDTTNKRE